MRRYVVTLIAVPVTAFGILMAVASTADATGPGGWDHVGHGSTATTASLNGTSVTALNTQDPGVLYVGGNFTSAGGVSNAKRIARWDGSTWSALGTTPLTNGGVFAIAYHAGKVYAGGTFLNAGGNPNADFLAVFNGSTWAPFCSPTVPGPAFGGNVNALQIIGNTLYVGGSFANGAGIDAADYLVACDLTTGAASAVVDSVAHAFGGAVYALTADHNGTLYAGGGFINLESIPAADHLAAYSGGGIWQAMGSGPGVGGAAVDSFVRSLAATGTDVYVGTDSTNVAGIANADHVAKWNGSAWSAVGADTAGTNGWFTNTSTIDALATFGPNVVAAGSFQNANGSATADDIAYFDGAQWRPIGSDGAGNGPLNQHPVALGITGGKVYVGGNFTSAGGDTLARFLASHALRLPDAMIGAASSGPFLGNNVYSPTAAGEVRRVTVTRGTGINLYVRVQNDGLVAASFKIQRTGGASGITGYYFAGSSNVTNAVAAGTYATASIPARSAVLLRLRILVNHGSAASATISTTVRSQTGTPPDVVRVVITAAH
jgi:hypothetical protein